MHHLIACLCLLLVLCDSVHGFSTSVRSPIALRGGSGPWRLWDQPLKGEDPSSSFPSAVNSPPNLKDVDPSEPPLWDADTPHITGARLLEQGQLLRDMATPYFSESIQARWLLVAVLVLTLASSGISVAFSYLGRDFWNALSDKNVEQFYQILMKYVAALALGAPISTLYTYQREQLAIHWRQWMTARTLELYQNNQVYYKLERNRLAIDNPDQRITEDVNSFTSFSLSLLITSLTIVIDFASFSTILWSIYPQLFLAVVLYAGGGTLIASLLGRNLVRLNFQQLRREADFRYSLVRWRDNAESIAFYAGEDLEGTAVANRLEKVIQNVRQIVNTQRNLEFFTTGYRYMVQILPIAVVAPRYFAGAIELGTISQATGAFNHILSDLSIIVNMFESLSSFSAGIERLSSFYEAMREVDPQKNATAPLLQVSNRTSLVATVEASHISHGEAEMIDAVIQDDATHAPLLLPEHAHLHHSMFPGDIHLQRWLHWNPSNDRGSTVLEMEHVDLVTPDRKRLLIRDLTVQLRPGEHLLIVGNSGTGKSSLLRAIAGLWTAGNGTIARPADDDVYFLPQRPYCTVGSLKDQLLYPSLEAKNRTTAMTNGDLGYLPKSHWLKQFLSDEDLLKVLEKVDLYDLAVRAGDGDPIQGLSVVMDWSNILSLGEQQRLAFGRLLVNRPKLVIMDEATSALDIGSETRMYQILQEMARKTLDSSTSSSKGALSESALTYVSVGHRPSLITFHNKKLRLGGDKGDHELSNIEKTIFEIPTQLY
jgi:vitamin B12/bleomycin/antimicrobial peptide transport system ATP-binding/permease protein